MGSKRDNGGVDGHRFLFYFYFYCFGSSMCSDTNLLDSNHLLLLPNPTNKVATDRNMAERPIFKFLISLNINKHKAKRITEEKNQEHKHYRSSLASIKCQRSPSLRSNGLSPSLSCARSTTRSSNFVIRPTSHSRFSNWCSELGFKK